MRQRQLYRDPTVEGSRTQQVRGTFISLLFIHQHRRLSHCRYHHVNAPPSRASRRRRRDIQLAPGPVPYQLIRERQREAVEIPQYREGALDRRYRLGVRLVVQAARRIW